MPKILVTKILRICCKTKMMSMKSRGKPHANIHIDSDNHRIDYFAILYVLHY